MAGLLERFKALGCNPRNIQAKVFGGACILSALQDLQGLNIGHIGERNVSCALEILAQEHIAVVQKDILGNRGREVSMISPTGAITLEFLSNADGNR